VQASELDYDLPPELIAQAPPTERDGARLAIVEIGKGLVQHARVLDLATALRPALFVVNDTRVIPARLFARKLTQGRVELLLVEPVPGETSSDPSVWYALARGAKGLRPGMKLGFDGAPLEATIRALREHGEVEIELQPHGGLSVREAIGGPLPDDLRRSRWIRRGAYRGPALHAAAARGHGPRRSRRRARHAARRPRHLRAACRRRTSTSTPCTPSGTRSPRRPNAGDRSPRVRAATGRRGGHDRVRTLEAGASTGRCPPGRTSALIQPGYR
jgi:hypothetical protein